MMPTIIIISICICIFVFIKPKKKSIAEIEQHEQIPDLTPPTYSKIKDSEVLITLLNMGGPKTNNDVLAFQQLLFNDPLLIRFPLSSLLQGFFAWLLITLRLKGVKERYHLIGGGSPIYKSTGAQLKALRTELRRRGLKADVTFSFNYSPPLPANTIKQAKQKGKKYLLPLSMYPHYSKATTGSNIHYLQESIPAIYPELKILPSPTYYLHDGYINAFVDRIHESLKPGEKLDDFYLIFSAHGLPVYFFLEGDPYSNQINQTTALIVDKLKRKDRWLIAYQSAVGPIVWLKPSTEEIIKAMGRRGIKKVLVVPVAFVGDHIETTCEIDIEYRVVAEKEGITDYRMSKALECHPEFIRALADSVEYARGKK